MTIVLRTMPIAIHAEQLNLMQKKTLKCYKCSAPLHFQKKRNWFGRNLLFYLPIKRYFCARCLKDRYRLITTEKLKQYHKV